MPSDKVLPRSKDWMTDFRTRRMAGLDSDASRPRMARSNGKPAFVRLYICREKVINSIEVILS